MNDSKANEAAAEPPLDCRVMPLRLRWSDRQQPVLGNELFAPVPAIEHSVGSAGYTVRRDMSGIWNVSWWHGNRGYSVGSEITEAMAKAAAQAHFDMLVRSLLETGA